MAQVANGHSSAHLNGQTSTNGTHENGVHELSPEELERHLPAVYDGQVPLGELVSRTVQAIYAELSELAETLPNMSDSARKRSLADWVVQTKKQVVKLYAVVKWARDADVVQKAMNMTGFLMEQNRQFEDAIQSLKTCRDALDSARLRNHDLLTSLDVLTTGSYRRLPTAIKKLVIPPTPLTDEEVAKTLADVEDVIRFRLKMNEIIPPEMSNYRIADGRVYFTAPKLFEVSLCVKGAQKDEGWFFVNVEFLFAIGGDRSGTQEFPRRPTGQVKRHITDEADARLAFYLSVPEDQIPPGVELPPRPQLPPGVVDAPLVRIFNFLQMMSLSYQLEILRWQAERLRSLGWAEYLQVERSNNRQTLTISYWIRKPPPTQQGRPQPAQRAKIPLLGGKIIVSIARAQTTPNNKSNRSPKARMLAELQEKAKLDTGRPSDEVEPFKFDVKWEPEKGALGVIIPEEDSRMSPSTLAIESDNLDVEALLRKVIARHTEAVLKVIQTQLQLAPATRNIFSHPGEIVITQEEGMHVLRTRLCADEFVVIAIDPRTGRLNLRDTGDLASAGKTRRYALFADKVNENPTLLSEILIRLKFSTIIDMAEQKANYLGLRMFRTRNFSQEEIRKLGPSTRGLLYIQLAKFPSHYLVIVITEEDFRYALISAEVLEDIPFHKMVMKDIGWLDVHRVHGHEIVVTPRIGGDDDVVAGQKRKRDMADDLGRVDVAQPYPPRFNLDIQVLRELYAYCCARVAYYKIEQQFKSRNIPYSIVSSTNAAQLPELASQSSLARSIPALCVQSSVILSGAPAAEAAMPNIRVIPLNWWSDRQAQVVTCVKLKYVQQPVGKRAGSSSVIRPSKRIIYDSTEAIVSFLSEDVDKCVDEFLEEWARVSKMVVIAREVAQMSRKKRWSDVRLLSFDLQTVEFAYTADYTLSITCTDQLSPTGGTYDLQFSRIAKEQTSTGEEGRSYNPHEDLEPYLRSLLQHGPLAPSLNKLVAILRDTLPIVAELEDIRVAAAKLGENVDILPKSAGWFRVLYGDFRHALDFRLMTGARVIILDASHSLFLAEGRGPSGAASAQVLGRKDRDIDDGLLLQPIPDFQTMVGDAVKAAVAQGTTGQIAAIDIGVVCASSAVRTVGRTLYERVLQRLKHPQGGN
ncbi:MED14-domain-containing protein [Wolfiporia cocos MD-104 SS10]|uniref:Mediator of RNA polymerase II transcription subunit 14 n=1 Tax=Wolfiporia cocos (strain MD-104) TaxID=742152 RepID=A0A2H3K4E7_WOLCO|nr:MED14-domain-containing protein [Wolfiporia cocos MD-104 SS10]